MGYIESLIGAPCWKCNSGHISLIDNGAGVHLICSEYPNSCQFISGPVVCPKCEGGFLNLEKNQKNCFLAHSICSFKYLLDNVDLHFGKKEANHIQKVKEEGLFIDFLSTLDLDELNRLWEKKVWIESANLPYSDNLDEIFIEKTIQKIRSIKWKIRNKDKS
jgi:hypothetical protein